MKRKDEPVESKMARRLEAALVSPETNTRILPIVAGVLTGLVFVLLGAVLFVVTGEAQRRCDEKLEAIRAGQVPSEILTVQSKYIYESRGGQHRSYHFLCTNAAQAKIVLFPPEDFYNTAQSGASLRAYHFPDGYWVPGWAPSHGYRDRWICLGVGILVGSWVSIYVFARARQPAQAG